MKTFNYDIDDCFDAACDGLGKEMGISSKHNSDSTSGNQFSAKNKRKKKKISLYEKLEFAFLLLFVKLFI